MCHLLQRIAANREARRHAYQHHYNPQQYNTNCQAVPRVEVQAELMRGSQPPAVTTPQTPKPAIPFTASPEQKMGVTHTTNEGLVLSRGKNGELHATIPNDGNSIGIGYVRKNGAYSTGTSFTRIYDTQPGGKSQLESITQDGTYALKVEHHGAGRTTLIVDMDPSLAAMKVQVGDKVYLLRESDIRALDHKVKAAAEAAKPPQIKAATPPASTNGTVVPRLVGKAAESINANAPAIRESLVRAFKAVEDAAKQAAVVKLAEQRASRAKAPTPKDDAQSSTRIEPSPSDRKVATRNGESTSTESAKVAELPKPIESKAPSTQNKSTPPKVSAAAEPTAATSESTTPSAENKVGSETKAHVDTKQAEAAKTSDSPKAGTEKADPVTSAESAKPTENSASSAKSEPHYDPVERAMMRFEKMVDSYRYMVNHGEGDSNHAKARRSLAEKHGREAGMSPEQIQAVLDGNPPSSTPRSSGTKSGGNAPEAASKASSAKGTPSPASGSAASTTTLAPKLEPSTTAPAATPPPPTMATAVDMKARLAEGLKRFNENARMSEWAKNNQFKAMTYTAALSEAVTGAMKANYGPNDPHSPVPHLLSLLNADIQKGFEFTTKQGGLTASIAAEATRSASDTAIAFGAFELANSGAMVAASTRVGTALGGKAAASVAGRTLGFAGVAYHGYSTFSDGSFAQQNDVQLLGSTSSPVIMGAVMGAPLGPVGAGGGAVLGAGSEAVGVAVGYARLQGNIASDWKKREVREALRLAEQGFVLPDSSPMVQSRKRFEALPAEHQEVLTDVARLATLARLTKELSATDLSALGFKSEPTASATPEEKNAVGTHNWERMIQLTEGRAGYNPYRLWAGDYLDEVRRSHPWLATKFDQVHKDAKAHFVNVYNHAPHVTYEVTDAKVTARSELFSHIHSAVELIPADTKPTDALKRLQEQFPGIEAILQQENPRVHLINNLEEVSGKTGRYRKLLDLESLRE